MQQFHRVGALFSVTIALASVVHFDAIVLAQSRQPRVNPSWGTVLQSMGQFKAPAGRQDEICVITPLRTAQTPTPAIWNERPLFVWRGKVGAIGVRETGTNTIIWQEAVQSTPALNRLRYTGERLKTGQTYDWLLFSGADDPSPQFWIPFQILPAPGSIQVTADLLTMQRTLNFQNANREAIALRRANYFVQRQLWTDVLQEAYAVNNPSQELKRITQTIERNLCPSRK